MCGSFLLLGLRKAGAKTRLIVSGGAGNLFRKRRFCCFLRLILAEIRRFFGKDRDRINKSQKRTKMLMNNE